MYDGVFEYNNTVGGYKLLGEKETDIFFGAYPSKEQIETAKSKGTEFEYIPIGYEAFVFFVIIITAISSFQVFDLIYLMTQGGPFDSTNVLVYAIYKNAFEYFNVGKASAIAYVLFAIILVLTLIQWSLRKKIVYNEID